MTTRSGRSEVPEVLAKLQIPEAANAILLPEAPGPRQTHEPVTYLVQTALRSLAGEGPGSRQKQPGASEHCINAFSTLLMSGQMRAAQNFVQLFMSRGADYGEIAENLFAAAARRMGERWRGKEATQTKVKIGISTLVRTDIAVRALLKPPAEARETSALFVSFPGQGHTLGLTLAAGCFRQNGWRVRYLPGATANTFLSTASSVAPDIIGMTATSDRDIEKLLSVMPRIRQMPFRPRIVVGGGSAHLATLGADAVVCRLDMGLFAGHRLMQ